MKQTELAKNLSVVWHPHPVTPYAGREVMLFAAEGYTIRQLLLNAQVDPHQEIVVYVDDVLIKVDEWDTLRPQDGQLVNVQAVVSGGGGDGSNPLQIVMLVAIVALTIWSGGAAAPWAGAMIGGVSVGTVVGAVVSIAGALLMGALFKPDGLSAGQTYEQASPTYSLTGAQNRARPYESMPVVMGTHRVVFDYASRPYTEYKSEDQYLYQIFHGGVSPTQYTDYKIGTNPLSNYADVELFYPSDNTGALLNFPGNVDSIAGAPLTSAAGWVTRTSSANTYQLGVDIEAVLFQANDEGGLDSTSVTLEIEYKATSSGTWLTPTQIFSSANDIAAGSIQTITETQDQGYEEIDPVTGESYWRDNIVTVTKTKFVAGSGGVIVLTSNSQKPRRVSLTFTVAKGTYDVRVRRTTADSTDPKLTQQTNWSILKSYQVDETDYTGQTRIAMSIRASEQLNGTVAQFSALGESSALYWNGTAWVVGVTSNPAHIFTHFARGTYNYNGKLMSGVGLPAAQLDLPALHAWAAFCTAEGLSFNAVLDGNQTAADVLNAIARCGLASPTWASGKLGVVWDYRNASPVASFGMSNIIRDTFDVSYINENLAEEIVVRFRNPAKDWEQDEVRVLAPGITDPLRTSAIDLFGCTDVDMAGKFANYLAAQQYYRRRRISWESDFEGFVCQRGDVVLLSHDLTQWGYSGRIVEVTGLTVTLDRAVPRNGSTEYLMITEPDGTMTTYNVQAATGESDQLVLSVFPTLQEGYSLMDHRWSFSPLATPGKKVKILSIDPMSESRLRIVATDEFSEFYDAWNGSFIAPPDLTLLPPVAIEANNLTVVSRIAVVNGYRTNRVTASWGVSGSVLYSRVRAYFNGDLIAEVPEALVQSFEYDVYAAGSFYIEITPFGVLGAGETITSTLTLGTLDAPPPPDSVTLSVGEDGRAATYTWTPVAGVQSYVIEVVVSGTARRTINVGNTLSYTYTVDDAIADGGVVRAYTFRVYSVANGIQSLTFASVAFSNPQIGALANARIEPMPNSLWFRCDKPTDDDFAAIRIWISKTSGFTPSALTVCYDGADNWVNIAADNDGNPLESGVVYYVRAAGYDSFGDDNLTYTGEFSAAVLSPAWGLIQDDIETSMLEAGLRDRIDLIDTAGDPDMPSGLIAALRQESTERNLLDADVDIIGQKLLEAELKVQENTDLLYDAGVTVDSTTGEVYIYAVRQAENELNEVDIRLSAAESNILLRATTTYVDEQIATAVIDPSQIAELGALTTRVSAAEVEIDGLNAAVTLKADLLTVNSQGARLTTAEADIDALEGEITLKADNTDLTSVDARVSTVEFQLNALDVPSITQSVTDTKFIARNQDQIAETQLKDILTGQANYEALDYGTAVARQDLTAYTDGKLLAEATARLELAAALTNTQAALVEESVARATADSAEASARQVLEAQVNNPTTGLAATKAAIDNEIIARANADGALASNITTLQTTVNGQTTSIQTNATSINGIEAKYTVKIDNNGYVSGYGLISTQNNATPTAEFAVIADRFSIAPVATNPNAVDGSPFFVLTAPQVISGVTIPAGTYMKAAYIHDATITTAKIADAAITNAKILDATIQNAKIANLDAGKINTGFLSADRIQANSIVADKIDSRNLTIKDGAGNVIFGAGTNLDWGRISNQPSGIYNSQISISSNGVLNGAGGGSVSLGGLGAGAFAYLNQLTAANVGTYIASAAIGTALIQNAAITNALIANAAIDNAKIANLDAGKITSGTIDAARINADSVAANIANFDAAKITSGIINSARIGDASIATAKIGVAQIDTLRIANNAVSTQVIFERTDFSSTNNTKSLVVPSGLGGTVLINLYCKPFSQPDMFINGNLVLIGYGINEEFYQGFTEYLIFPYFYTAPAGSFTITIYDDGRVSQGWTVHTLLTQR